MKLFLFYQNNYALRLNIFNSILFYLFRGITILCNYNNYAFSTSKHTGADYTIEGSVGLPVKG